MITHVEKDNLFNMLYSQSGVLKYRDVVYEYAMSYGGVQRITFRGKEKKVDFDQKDQVSRKVLKFENGIELIERNLKYVKYGGYLADCFRQFEEEIEANMYEINTQKNKEEYITNIYNKLNQLIEHEISELENIWKYKPQKEKLAQSFIEYIRSRNLDFDKIDEFEVSTCSFFFQTEPLKKLEFDKLTKDEKKEIYNFNDYYSYDGHYDERINVLELNIEHTRIFLKYFLKQNYSNYIKNDNETFLKKTFNHNLNDENFEAILKLVTKINLFSKALNIDELKSIFNCTNGTYYKVNNNQELAVLFNYLQPKYISPQWQSVIEKNQLFKGIKDKFIKAKNLSSSYQNADLKSENNKLIITTIKSMN